MDIREIESICAVDIYHNYSNAAYHIASSPAVISKHVSKVEKELGITIFERASKTHPVELTEAGKQIIDYLHAIVRMYHCVQQTAESLSTRSSDTLTVGCSPRVANFRENELLARFAYENPNTVLYRKTDSPAGLTHMLLTGVVDAIFLPMLTSASGELKISNALQDPDIEFFEILHTDTLKVGLPDNHPLASQELITREQFHLLHNETFLLSNDQKNLNHEMTDGYLYNFFEFTGNMKIRYVDVTEPAIGLELVKRGVGILIQSGITPRRMDGVNFIPVEGWDRRATLYCIHHKSSKSPALKRLLECVAKFSEENSANL